MIGARMGVTKSVMILAALLILLVFISSTLMIYCVSLERRYEAAYKEYLALQGEYQSAQSALEEKEAELEEVNQKLEEALAELDHMRMAYQELQKEYEVIQTLYRSQGEEYEKQVELMRQLREILYYRQFTVYDYKNDEYYMPYVIIPAWMYLNRRLNTSRRIPYFGAEYEQLQSYFIGAVNSWREDWPIQSLASQLRAISGDDDEFYANLVLQVVHQLFYNVTDYTKYPIETLVEGSGDCDTLAVLLASLLEAGGLDAVILLGYVKGAPEEEFGGTHALVAVYLPEMPDDFPRENYWKIPYNGKDYWLMEPTWFNTEEQFSKQGYIIFPWQYEYEGSAVGDFMYLEFETEYLIDV